MCRERRVCARAGVQQKGDTEAREQLPPFSRAASEELAAPTKSAAKPEKEPPESEEVVPRGVWAEALAKTNAAVAAQEAEAQKGEASRGEGLANGSAIGSSAQDAPALAREARRLRRSAAARQRRLLSYNGGTGVWRCQCRVCAAGDASPEAVRYWWAQDTGEVVLSLRVPPSCRSRDVSVTVSKRRVRVVVEHAAAASAPPPPPGGPVAGHARTVVDGALAYSVVDQDLGSPDPKP